MISQLGIIRNWPGVLGRFSSGLSTLYLLSVFSPNKADILSVKILELDWRIESIGLALIGVSASLAIGTFLTSVGYRLLDRQLLSFPAQVIRAMRVGETKNDLLYEFYREATSRVELAASAIGLWLVFLIAGTVWTGRLIFDLPTYRRDLEKLSELGNVEATAFLEQIPSTLDAMIVLFVAFAFTSYVAFSLRFSTTRALQALDECLIAKDVKENTP